MSKDSPLKGFRPIRPGGNEQKDQQQENQIDNAGINYPPQQTASTAGQSIDFFDSSDNANNQVQQDSVAMHSYKSVDQNTKPCSACGFQNTASAKFCGSCGASLDGNAAQVAGYQVPGQGQSAAVHQPLPQPQPMTNMPPNPNPYGAGNQGMPGYPYPYPYPVKSKSTGKLLEILIGVIFLSGWGWIYAGKTGTGIGLMALSFVMGLISGATAGIGFLCTIPLQIVLIVISTNQLMKYMNSRPDLFVA